MVAAVLRRGKPARSEVPVLAFENTLLPSLAEQLPHGWRTYQTVTDRICSGFTVGENNTQSVCATCEHHLEIVASKELAAVFSLKASEEKVRFVPERYLPVHVRRKRALVNSVHEILAVLHLNGLASLGVSSSGQHVSVLHGLLDRYPDFRHLLDVRMRAADLSWRFFSNSAAERRHVEVEALCDYILHCVPSDADLNSTEWCRSTGQRVFDGLLGQALDVEKRVASARDGLNRLIDVYVAHPGNSTRTMNTYRILLPSSWSALCPAGVVRLTTGPAGAKSRRLVASSGSCSRAR